MKSSIIRRIIGTVGLFIVLVFLVFLSWKLSSQTGTQSNHLSIRIADQMIDWLDRYFDLDRGDMFWKVTFNQLLRKAAHFIEYALIGTVMCIMLNIAFNRVVPAAVFSVLLSPLFGIIDEYHQRFSAMRTSRILDICIDTAGVLTGVLLVTLLFGIVHYIKKLKRRIWELEQRNK
ncbi:MULTISPECIES: VanZ family protein [Dehalobacter]|uniref:Teicoplanin resistance protein VanZ n=1 Tax=Dehalobacter restrictus (strain DSM 9455 / PER-K23) TaxID=871738 RepID=A0ABM5P6L7_DEHRP|nr:MULTISPECIES: VanZ family protein [Dehalobacter]AHF10343.1 teicoplanin resistance protein VanZ [Dehalobacter restrictus DSM 9455]MDJ0305583.1 VanZ family protein [Dehalobacter sp.]